MDSVHFLSKVEVVDEAANERRFEIEFEQLCEWTTTPIKDRHDAAFSVYSDENGPAEELMSRWVLTINKWHLSSSSMPQVARNPASTNNAQVWNPQQNQQQGPRVAGPPSAVGPPGTGRPSGPMQQPGQPLWSNSTPRFNPLPMNYGPYATGQYMGPSAMWPSSGGPINNPNQPGPSGLQQQQQAVVSSILGPLQPLPLLPLYQPSVSQQQGPGTSNLGSVQPLPPYQPPVSQQQQQAAGSSNLGSIQPLQPLYQPPVSLQQGPGPSNLGSIQPLQPLYQPPVSLQQGPGPSNLGSIQPLQPLYQPPVSQQQLQVAGPSNSGPIQPLYQPPVSQQQNSAPLAYSPLQNNNRQLPIVPIRQSPSAQAITYPVLLRLDDGPDDLECSVSFSMQVFAAGTGRSADLTLNKTTMSLDETRLCGSMNVRPDKFIVRFTICHKMETPATKRCRFSTESDHGSTLERIVDEQQFGDCSLLCGDREIKVYKGILSVYSPVFASMFVHDTIEAQNNEVQIDDIDFETLQQMVRFCYSAKDPPAEFAFTLFQVAERYQIDELKSIAARQIADQLTVENACDVLAMADMHGDEPLKQAAKTFIVTNATEIVLSDGYKKLATDRLELISEVIVAMANRDASNVVRSNYTHK